MSAPSVVRTLAEVLTAGLVVLELGLLLAWWLASSMGAPGPGAFALVGHGVAAVLALWLARTAGRRQDRSGMLAAAAVPLVMALVGLLFWWT